MVKQTGPNETPTHGIDTKSQQKWQLNLEILMLDATMCSGLTCKLTLKVIELREVLELGNEFDNTTHYSYCSSVLNARRAVIGQ